MSDNLDFQDFIRVPFKVQATQITEENIGTIAKKVGELRTNEEGKSYIALDKRVIPNVGRAFVGWWLTTLGDNLRCYSPKVFKEQFMEMPSTQPVSFNFDAEVHNTVS